MLGNRRIQLSAPGHRGSGTGSDTPRFISDRVDARQLAEGKRITATIIRAGTFTDPRYGTFEVSRELLETFIKNFDAGTYGQEIALDIAHEPNEGAAGYFRRLFLDGNKLRGEIELTDYGVEAIKRRGFRYLSADYVENFVDNETGDSHGPLLRGAGLVVRPAIKRLDPIQLAETDTPTILCGRAARILTEEAETVMKEHLKKLRAKLVAKKLSEGVIEQILASAEANMKQLGEDEKALAAAAARFEDLGKQLAEEIGDKPATLNIQLGESGESGKQLTEDDVERILADRQAQAEKESKQLTETKAARVKTFNEAIDGAEGIDEDTKKVLREAEDLITPEMSEAQVKKLADRQIALGNRMSTSSQLAGMGYHVAGSPSVNTDEINGVKRLQESIDNGLRGSVSGANGRLRLPEKDSPFVQRVLAEYDRMNHRSLVLEERLLAGGETNIGDTSFPAGFTRTVIREALSDLNILQLVQTLTDPQAQATTQVPYEERDTSSVTNDGVVFEGQGIPGASIAQKMDLAYVLPRKLAMRISNEVMHFARASRINWDAYGRNVESNARVMRELVHRAIANEMQRASDTYLAQDVADEAVGGQLGGSTSIIKTAEFPIVRPHQQYDMQGNAVGSESNPITVTVDGTPAPRYDGTGNQSAGTYYRVTNYNLGYIQLVDETGSPVTPTATAATVSYSYATNVVKFDMDNGTTDIDVHLNGLLRKIGARKAVLSGDRMVNPDFLLMSPVLNDTITNAEQFAAERKRSGTDTDGMGDLEMVKGLPAFGTNAPGIDLGDERIVMGVRGTTSYTVAKPFTTGQPFEAVDSSGRPTGQKVAYGEEYSAIHTPAPIRERLTSVIAYSASNR